MRVITVDMGRVMLQVEGNEIRRLARACALLAEQMQQQQRDTDLQALETWTSLLELAGHMAQMQQVSPDMTKFESNAQRGNGSLAATDLWSPSSANYDEEDDRYEKR